MKNDIDRLKEIINKGANIEQALIDHFKNFKDEILLTMESSNGDTLISLALDNNMEKFLLLVVEKYPNFAKIQNILGFSLLHVAANKGFSDVLIKALEVDPDLAKVQDIRGYTFLHHAADNGLEDVLNKALEIDPKLLLVRDNKGETVLDLAEEEANNEDCPAGFQQRVKLIKNKLTKAQGNTSAKELLSARKNKERI